MEGQVTQSKIDFWKKENPQGVHQVTTKDQDGTVHVTYVKKPTLHEIGAASRFAESDPVKSGKVMYDTCRLGGSASVETDDEMKMGVIAYLGKLFKIAEAEGKPL